ncbi:class I SAM-dependent methyltransferase [Coraliomargarita parva]|uniref:class I SAM-dependent methyltransferase n=1 Tax=Coraliomargarita parva TaxID=3014050 RepID=UPI0022B59141|nr:class I SAM-dependent methyltransferase [Coraliomargarita parva]
MHPETTNYQKFQTSNPVVRRLLDNFFETIKRRLGSGFEGHLLDAGCGEGLVLHRMGSLLPKQVSAFDINPDCVAYVKAQWPGVQVSVQDIYNLPYADGEFDLVLCLEVLEHLSEPEKALAELKRVSSGRLILSVPYEPWFQLGSLLRGKYIRSFGNHPEHVNHWSPKTFRAFLENVFERVMIETSFPWIIAEVDNRNA